MSTIDYPATIKLVVSGTPTEITESHKVLDKAFVDEPSKYFDELFTLLAKSEDVLIRKFCINNLNKSFSAFTLPENHFAKFSPEGITRFKSEIFAILAAETDATIKHELSKFVGEISASIICNPKTGGPKAWPEFTGLVMELIKSDNVTSRIDGNRILGIYFTYGDEDYNSLATEIKGYVNKALSHSNSGLVHSGLVLLAGYVSTLDPKDTKQFNEFTQRVLEAFIAFIKKDDPISSIYITDLREYVKECPKMFETVINKFTKDVDSVLRDKKVSQAAKETVLELFVGMNLQHPKKLEKSLKDVLNLIVQFFSDYTVEPDDEWKDPIRKTEDNSMEPIFSKCTTFFDMVLGSVNPEISLPILKTQLAESHKTKDWKKKTAALACLSQIGEYCEDIMQLNPYIQTSLLLLEDEHPKVRYTVLHLLGQVAEDRSDEFAEKFHHIINDICKRLNDPVPRVVSHVYACLTNIVEHCEEKDLEPYMKKIFPAAIKAIKEAPWHVKETAIPTIAAFGESCKKSIEPYWQEASAVLLSTFENTSDESAVLIRAECIEAITLLALAVGKEKSKEISDVIAGHMATLLEKEAQQLTKTDFLTYVLAGIPRQIMTFGADYEPTLDKLVPNIIKTAINLQAEFFKVADAIANGEETSSLKDDLVMLLNCFCELFKNYPKYMIQHLETATSVAKSLIKETVEEISEGALDCFSAFFAAVKATNDDDKIVQALNDYLKIYTDLFKNFQDPALLTAGVDNTEQLIEAGGKYLKEQGVEDLLQTILNVMSDSCTRIEVIQSDSTAPEGEDDEEEEEEELGNEDDEWDLQLACCTAIGKLYKAQPHACILGAKTIFQNIIPQYITEGKGERSKLTGVYLMVDLVENMGPNLMKNEFPKLTEGFCYFATHEYAEIRQASLYGLGVIAQNSGEFFKTVGANVITAVVNGIEKKLSEDEEGDDYADSAKDNGISSLGKILKHQAENISDYNKMFEMWVNYLPLKVDHAEGVETYGFLVDTLLSENASVVLGADGSRMSKVLGVFAEIVDSKFINEEIDGKIKKVIEILLGNDTYKEVVTRSIKKLPKDQQKKIEALKPRK